MFPIYFGTSHSCGIVRQHSTLSRPCLLAALSSGSAVRSATPSSVSAGARPPAWCCSPASTTASASAARQTLTTIPPSPTIATVQSRDSDPTCTASTSRAASLTFAAYLARSAILARSARSTCPCGLEAK